MLWFGPIVQKLTTHCPELCGCPAHSQWKVQPPGAPPVRVRAHTGLEVLFDTWFAERGSGLDCRIRNPNSSGCTKASLRCSENM